MRLITLMAACAMAGPIHAKSPISEVVCDTKPRMEHRLETRLQSTRSAYGLRGPEQVMEVWTNENGNWTLVVAYASGQSCIVAMGEHWQAPVLKDPA